MDSVKLFAKLGIVFQAWVIQSSFSIPVTYKTYSCPAALRTSNTHLVFEKVCYEFVTNRKDYWVGARHDCNNRGGDLAIVSNSDIQYFLQTTLSKLNVGNHGIWIGLHDRHREGHFTWVDGTPMEYSHWAVHEGHGILHLTQDCVQIQMGDHGLWHDRECKLWPNKFSYVCQYPAVVTVHTVKPDPTTTTSTRIQTNAVVHTTRTHFTTTSEPSTSYVTSIPTTKSTTLPSREYPLPSTVLPNRKYPLTSTALPNREYPLTSTAVPNREYPLTSTAVPNREYPLPSTALPNREYPSKSTVLPNREYSSKLRVNPSRSTTQSQNSKYVASATASVDIVYQSSTPEKKEHPSSSTDNFQGHFLTPKPDGPIDGCPVFVCNLNCSDAGYELGPDDCPSCRCNV